MSNEENFIENTGTLDAGLEQSRAYDGGGMGGSGVRRTEMAFSRFIHICSMPVSTAVLAVFILLLCTPVFGLIWTSEGLFATQAPLNVIAPYFQAMALTSPVAAPLAGQEAQSISFMPVAHLPYLILINWVTPLAETPGRALLTANLLVMGVVMSLCAYFSATRLGGVAAICISLILLFMIAVPGAIHLEHEMIPAFGGVFLLSIACFLPPLIAKSSLQTKRAAVIEGVICGVILLIILFSSVQMFLAASGIVVMALVYQGQRGMVMGVIALAMVFILSALFEGFYYFYINNNVSFILEIFRQQKENIKSLEFTIFHSPMQILILGIILVTLFSTNLSGIRLFLRPLFILFFGHISFLIAGVDPIILYLLALLIVVLPQAGTPLSKDYELSSDLSALRVIGLASIAIVGTHLSMDSTSMLMAQARTEVLEKAARLGLSFQDDGKQGALLVGGRITPGFFNGGVALSPADQAIIVSTGIEVAQDMRTAGHSVRIIAAHDIARLVPVKFMQSLNEIKPLNETVAEAAGDSEIVLVPRVSLDAQSELTRQQSQSALYMHYKRDRKAEMMAAGWEVWRLK